MQTRTGQTIYEQVLSLDADNNIVTGATFDATIYFNNSPYSGASPTYSLTDGVRSVFTFQWSADTVGQYQLYAKNNSTGVVFVSDVVDIRPDSEFESTTIYLGM
jgi:hypothetical protein